MDNFCTRSEYARLCGVTRQAIADRIKTGRLELVDRFGLKLIDLEKYPPVKYEGRPKKVEHGEN